MDQVGAGARVIEDLRQEDALIQLDARVLVHLGVAPLGQDRGPRGHQPGIAVGRGVAQLVDAEASLEIAGELRVDDPRIRAQEREARQAQRLAHAARRRPFLGGPGGRVRADDPRGPRRAPRVRAMHRRRRRSEASEALPGGANASVVLIATLGNLVSRQSDARNMSIAMHSRRSGPVSSTAPAPRAGEYIHGCADPGGGRTIQPSARATRRQLCRPSALWMSRHRRNPRGSVGRQARVGDAVEELGRDDPAPQRPERHRAVRGDDVEAVEPGNVADHRSLVFRHRPHADAGCLDAGAGQRGEVGGHGAE